MKHKLLILVLGLLILCASLVSAQEQWCACCWYCTENGQWICVDASSKDACDKVSSPNIGTWHSNPCNKCAEIDCPLEAPEFTPVSAVIAVVGAIAILYGLSYKKKK